MRQDMRSAQVMTFTSEQDRVLWPTLARSRSGQVVLLSSCDVQEIRRWDVFTGRMLWCSDGSLVVAAATEDGVLRLDALTGEKLDGPEMAGGDTVWDVATGLLPDRRAFIAGAGHGNFRVYLWDAATGAPLGPSLLSHTAPVKAVTAITLPDGTALVTTEDESGRILR
ncbi:WD40 repeat domain-containing protein [Streptacidiphilus sp. N1-3]|uniref:WD40 repeat domain-containing protein n=1 Tax=Streptacidiphilus alkalitolerans TaxID=3342712 RepID=A0ABV6WZW3_9ACTN